MDGWRISKRRYANPPAAAFDGEGSRRRGGRWTSPGARVAYASSSLALASLEYFVNLESEDASPDLVSIRLTIPDSVRCERLDVSSLVPASSVCLLAPSAVVPEEFNLPINPLHPDFTDLLFAEPSAFSFDPRMWKSTKPGSGLKYPNE
jgi:RES domain-containing protein